MLCQWQLTGSTKLVLIETRGAPTLQRHRRFLSECQSLACTTKSIEFIVELISIYAGSCPLDVPSVFVRILFPLARIIIINTREGERERERAGRRTPREAIYSGLLARFLLRGSRNQSKIMNKIIRMNCAPCALESAHAGQFLASLARCNLQGASERIFREITWRRPLCKSANNLKFTLI